MLKSYDFIIICIVFVSINNHFQKVSLVRIEFGILFYSSYQFPVLDVEAKKALIKTEFIATVYLGINFCWHKFSWNKFRD